MLHPTHTHPISTYATGSVLEGGGWGARSRRIGQPGTLTRRRLTCVDHVLPLAGVRVLLEAGDLALAYLPHVANLGVEALAGLLVRPCVARFDHDHRARIVKLLGGPTNPTQIFPEPELLLRLEAGQLDAAIFYRHEVLAHGVPFIELPDEINQSNPRFASLYQECSYTNEKGVTTRGVPAVFTITIPSTARNLPGAAAFVGFLLSEEGRGMIEKQGLRKIPLQLDGDASKLPAGLAALLPPAKAS